VKTLLARFRIHSGSRNGATRARRNGRRVRTVKTLRILIRELAIGLCPFQQKEVGCIMKPNPGGPQWRSRFSADHLTAAHLHAL